MKNMIKKRELRNPKTKFYKLEFADKEWNFLSSKILEAANEHEAWQMAEEVTKRYFGNPLDLYLIDNGTGQIIKTVKRKKPYIAALAKSTI